MEGKVTIRMSRAEHAQLHELASEYGLTLSELVRRALRRMQRQVERQEVKA
jgi:predicted HicB family RNase H-like nuclease